MNVKVISQASDIMIEIEELEPKVAPSADAGFLD